MLIQMGFYQLAKLTSHERRGNVYLILSTHGGIGDSGFRIARTLRERYKRFYLFVPSVCKSAGTLIALGADELILSDEGELGPLDAQVRKLDEIGELGSGLEIGNN